jgi:hypothetical protein
VHSNLASLPGWFWEHRHERIVRNTYWSILGWLVMYAVFYVEVSHLNFDSQNAKLTITPLGFPVGLTIQWLVFRDRMETAQGGKGLWLRVKQVCLTTYHTAREIGMRWVAAKLISFGINQYAYAMMLHALGLPYLLAYPAAASVLALVYYRVNNLWVFVDKWWEGPVMGYLCYHINNLWLTWTVGSFRRIETA